MCDFEYQERREYTTIARDVMWAVSDILNSMKKWREGEEELPTTEIKEKIAHSTEQLQRLMEYTLEVESRR